MRWTPIHSSLLGLPGSSLLRPIGATALGARSEHVVREAAARGYSTVYLFTPSASDFFSHLGWSIVEQTRYKGADVVIMSHTQLT
jgi:hypothetical protein